MAAYGLYTHIASNRFRSMLLLAGLFLLVYVVVYAGALIIQVVSNAGGPVDYFPLDPVALFFGQVGVSAKAPHPNTALLAANFMLSRECETFLAKFGRIPTRADVESNPPGIIAAIGKKQVITALLTPQEEGKWQKLFNQLFKGR